MAKPTSSKPAMKFADPMVLSDCNNAVPELSRVFELELLTIEGIDPSLALALSIEFASAVHSRINTGAMYRNAVQVAHFCVILDGRDPRTSAADLRVLRNAVKRVGFDYKALAHSADYVISCAAWDRIVELNAQIAKAEEQHKTFIELQRTYHDLKGGTTIVTHLNKLRALRNDLFNQHPEHVANEEDDNDNE